MPTMSIKKVTLISDVIVNGDPAKVERLSKINVFEVGKVLEWGVGSRNIPVISFTDRL